MLLTEYSFTCRVIIRILQWQTASFSRMKHLATLVTRTHAVQQSTKLPWLVRDMLFRDHFLCFEFTDSKFRVYKHEIPSFQTRGFEFTNLKVQVYKHEILSLQTRNFEFTNSKYFEFKFRVCKLEAEKLITK